MLVRPKVKRVHVGGVKQERGERRDAFLSFFYYLHHFWLQDWWAPKKGLQGAGRGGSKQQVRDTETPERKALSREKINTNTVNKHTFGPEQNLGLTKTKKCLTTHHDGQKKKRQKTLLHHLSSSFKCQQNKGKQNRQSHSSPNSESVPAAGFHRWLVSVVSRTPPLCFVHVQGGERLLMHASNECV